MTDIETVLTIYRDLPIDNGDVVMLTDQKKVLQFDALSDNWNPGIRDALASALADSDVTELFVAIARPDAVLLPQDHALWADLREELLSSALVLHPPLALPAAA